MDYVTVKCYAETRRLLRLIAAQTGEQMVQVMDRLCREEWSKFQPVVTSVVTSSPDQPSFSADDRQQDAE